MIVYVPEVFLRVNTDLRHAPSVQFADRLQHRLHRMFKYYHLLFKFVEPLYIRECSRGAEDLFLDLLKFRFKHIQYREVAIYHRIHQRVVDEARPLLQ